MGREGIKLMNDKENLIKTIKTLKEIAHPNYFGNIGGDLMLLGQLVEKANECLKEIGE